MDITQILQTLVNTHHIEFKEQQVAPSNKNGGENQKPSVQGETSHVNNERNNLK